MAWPSYLYRMNNVAASNAVRIENPFVLTLLEKLIFGATVGGALPEIPVCPEPASAGETCSGNAETLSTYLAPRSTYYALNYAGEDFEVARSYFFRCRY